MKPFRLLISAGNYEIIHRVRQAVGGAYALSQSFSHRDTLWALRTPVDVVIVDAAMFDRHTGDQTASIIHKTYPDLPLIVFVGDHSSSWVQAQPGIFQLTSLAETDIYSVIERALKLGDGATLPGRPDTRPIQQTQTLWSSEEVKTLFALGRSLTEVLDLSEVLNRVVEAARRLTDADEGMILLPDSETGDLYLRARVGIDSDVARNFRVKTRDSFAGHVFNTGEPVVIGARGPHKVKTEYFVNALLYVPILLKGRPIGVLGVNNRTKDAVFNERDCELLENLASYAAVAIENARVHGQSVKRTRELKSLIDATQAISESLVLDRMLLTICEQVMRVLDVPYAAVLDWSQPDSSLELSAFRSDMLWRAGHEFTYDLRGLTRVLSAIQSGDTVLLEVADSCLTDPEQRWLARECAAALRLIPVRADERTFGAVIGFYAAAPPSLSEENETSARLAALEIYAQTALGASHTIIKKAREINTLLQSDWCEIAFFQAEEALLQTLLRVGEAVYATADTVSRRSAQRLPADIPSLSVVLNQIEPLRLSSHHLELDAPEMALLRLSKTRAVLVLPMVQRGQVRALVILGDLDGNREFSLREIDLARAVLNHASTVLENARLLYDLERSISELRAAQTRLIQAARLSAMGELAAAVAHQINNPLTTIVLDTELLLDSGKISPENREVIEAILRSGKRAAGVVRRMLSAVRPADTPAAVREPIDVVYTVEETIALVRSHLTRAGIRLEASLPSDPKLWVEAIRGELEDVWMNLLLNAHDALVGKPDARIDITMTFIPAQSEICVTVADNGPGIPDEIQCEIFKPFFTTKPVGEGTGLGLYICQQVVERAGGRIEVVSNPESGTRFNVYLPAKADAVSGGAP